MIATSLDAMNAYKNKIRDCGSNTFMFLYMQDSNFFFFLSDICRIEIIYVQIEEWAQIKILV